MEKVDFAMSSVLSIACELMKGLCDIDPICLSPPFVWSDYLLYFRLDFLIPHHHCVAYDFAVS